MNTLPPNNDNKESLTPLVWDKYTESVLAEKLGVSQQTVNAWITDIRARQKTNRDSIIIRLSRLEWGLRTLPYHPLQKKSMKHFLKIFSPWPMTTQSRQPSWPF